MVEIYIGLSILRAEIVMNYSALTKEKEELIRQLNDFFQWPLPFPFTPHNALFYKGFHYYLKFYIMCYWYGRSKYNGRSVFNVKSVFNVREEPCSNTKSKLRQLRKTEAWLSSLIGCNSQDKNIFVRLAWRKDAFICWRCWTRHKICKSAKVPFSNITFDGQVILSLSTSKDLF